MSIVSCGSRTRNLLRASWLMAGMMAFGVAAAEPAAATSTPYVQVAEQVAPGVHAFYQPEPVFGGVVGNVVMFEQRAGIVLVDSGGSHGVGARVVEMVKRISDKPVTAVVLTHWHNDHPLGLSAILEAWPGAEVIASVQTAAHMRAGRLGKIPDAPDATYEARRVELIREAVAAARKSAAEATEPAVRDGWLAAAASEPVRIGDAAGTHVVFPTITFEKQLVLEDADAPVHVLQLGRANTDGDVVAWAPRQKVVATGDIVVAPLPYMFNVFPSEHLQVLDAISELDFAVLVPGHGRPQRDRAYLQRLSGLIRAVQDRLRPVAAGRTLEEATAAIDVTDLRRQFVGDDPWLASWFDAFSSGPLIDSVYRELRGEALGPPPPAGR